jgi:ribosome biogenesis GTPase A
MAINWYPGHMKKTNEMIRDNLKLVDIVVEVIDARIPLSSRNPMIDQLIGNKYHVILMNKSDLADPIITEQWVKYFNGKNKKSIPYVATNYSPSQFMSLLKDVSKEVMEKYKKKGFVSKRVRAMIVGIPNSGKSTFINNVAKKKSTVTGNKPGVTKGKQWIKIKDGIDLLDTPGILWPKIESDDQGYRLAATGAIRDDILNKNDIVQYILSFMKQKYPKQLEETYEIQPSWSIDEMIEHVGLKNGCLSKGNQLDEERTIRMILDDFRKGKIGRITMEKPTNADN